MRTKKKTKPATEPAAVRLEDLRAASVTTGATAEARLRWLASFVRAALPAHSAAAQEAADCLVAIAWPVPPYVEVPPPLTRDELVALHAELGALLRDLVTTEGDSTRWPKIDDLHISIRRMTPVGRTEKFRLAQWSPGIGPRNPGRTREGILLAVYHLVLHGGERLFACLECKKPYVASKRQDYCEEKCSQRARTRTHAPKRRAKSAR
jgi:hypothetical protein